MDKFSKMVCGFLPTAVLMYSAVQAFELGNSRGMVTLIPNNLNTNIYSSNDEIYPMMYARGSVQYQSLINPEFEISRRITGITGITNEMLEDAPSGSDVMPSLVDFLGNNSLVAHNASFDSNFFHSELAISKIKKSYQFTCSMRLARKVFPNSPNHKLETLLEYRGIEHSGQFHRALADVNATYHLWIDMNQHISKARNRNLLTLSEMKSLL
jgi:DNA polymerase-3 subunit epsilon